MLIFANTFRVGAVDIKIPTNVIRSSDLLSGICYLRANGRFRDGTDRKAFLFDQFGNW